VIRWYATTEPQQNLLPASGTRAFGTEDSVRHSNKPAPREAPPSA
jgi:hypothetical protein